MFNSFVFVIPDKYKGMHSLQFEKSLLSLLKFGICLQNEFT